MIALAADHDGSRLEVRGREHHDDSVHVREDPQRHAFVRHAVLQAEDWHLVRRHRGELFEGRRGLMRLGGHQRNVVLGPVHGGGIVDDRHVEDGLAVRIAQPQAVARQHVEVSSARDQHHRKPVLVEAATGGTSDRARTDHHVSHRPSISGRRPDMPTVCSR